MQAVSLQFYAGIQGDQMTENHALHDIHYPPINKYRNFLLPQCHLLGLD